MTDADYDYILDKIERPEKLILNGMLVLIVMMNSIEIIIIIQYLM